MSQLTALSLSIAVLGGIWVFLALGPLSGLVLVWAGFLAWGCYFHSGADSAALKKTIAGMIYGAVLAGIALYLLATNPLNLPGLLSPAVYVAVTVFFLVIVAGNSLLSAVPANVYGYAATVAYVVQTVDEASVTSASVANPVVVLALSVILGALFGMLSGKLAGMLSK